MHICITVANYRCASVSLHPAVLVIAVSLHVLWYTHYFCCLYGLLVLQNSGSQCGVFAVLCSYLN
mgnify:CR=1 FL=1